MTRERAKELLPVIQAFAEGKTIQWRAGERADSRWEDMKDAFPIDKSHVGERSESHFNEFRIKPEPREFWLLNRKGEQLGYGNKAAADSAKERLNNYPDETKQYEVIHVKEVLE